MTIQEYSIECPTSESSVSISDSTERLSHPNLSIRIPEPSDAARRILVKMVIKNLHEIDTINQWFRCNILIKLDWIGDPSWKPDLVPLDAVKYNAMNNTYKYDPCNQRSSYRTVLQGTFLERLELYAFPFDIQKLHVQLELSNGDGDSNPDTYAPRNNADGPVILQQQPYFIKNRNSMVDMDSFYIQDAWDVSERHMVLLQGRTRPHLPTSSTTLCAFILLRRKCQFYVWNIMMPSSIMALLSTLSFALDITELEGRFNLIITLMLTMVAFKNAISGYLPVTSYLTCLDKYVIACLGYLVMICMMNMSICLWIPHANSIMAWIAVCIWGVAHAGTILLLKNDRLRTYKSLEEKDTVDGLYDRVVDVEPFPSVPFPSLSSLNVSRNAPV